MNKGMKKLRISHLWPLNKETQLHITRCKRLTKEFISKTSLNACFCHAGLSGIFLQEGFPTSGNDIQVALLMTILVSPNLLGFFDTKNIFNYREVEKYIPKIPLNPPLSKGEIQKKSKGGSHGYK
jgi:hypothetical protein